MLQHAAIHQKCLLMYCRNTLQSAHSTIDLATLEVTSVAKALKLKDFVELGTIMFSSKLIKFQAITSTT